MEGGWVPTVLTELPTGAINPEVFADLVLKLAYMEPTFTTQRVVQQLCLPLSIVSELLEQAREDQLVEVLGPDGPFNYRYSISVRGRERAQRLLEISSYVGPAPVLLEEYVSSLDWQCARLPHASPERVDAALSDLVLPTQAAEVIGLAVSSGRSLFIFGPPGCGKTSVGRLVHSALQGHLWIPHCIGIEGHIIRLFDQRFHKRVPLNLTREQAGKVDHRWVCIERPFIVVGGELTLEDLDLSYDPGLGYHEAPLHMKANAGTFLLDDCGCQPVEPHKLLNRWIIPLEYQVDHLTLRTGQKMEVPFRQMMIISTNLDPDVVMTPALLRRMGYRLFLGAPTPESYAQIFTKYAARCGVDVPDGLVEGLIKRYETEQRPISCCEPHDLIERSRHICSYRDQPLELNEDIMDLAWRSYFGEHKEQPGPDGHADDEHDGQSQTAPC